MEEGEAGIKTEEMYVQLLDGDGFHTSGECRNYRIVLHVQASKDLGDDFRIGESRGSACDFISKALDPAKIVSHGHVTFFEICEFDAGVDGLGLTLGSEHGVDGAPNFGWRL